jgi:hypothetical protein
MPSLRDTLALLYDSYCNLNLLMLTQLLMWQLLL